MPCDPTKPFGEPVPVFGLNRDPGLEQTIRLSPDELTAYITAGPDPWTAHLFVATRASTSEPFGRLSPLAPLVTPTFELGASATGDGLALFFTTQSAAGTSRIFVSTRASVADPFATASELLLQANSPDEFDVYVLPDGTALYFSTQTSSGNAMFRAELNGTTAGPLTRVTVTTDGRYAVVSQDELSYYYAADNPFASPWGNIFVATRASKADPFGAPRYVAELNSTQTGEIPQWIAPDGCRLYLSRTEIRGGNYFYSSSLVAYRTRD